MLIADQDSHDRRNYLRLPEGSFHPSQHPALFSWDGSLATNTDIVAVLNNNAEQKYEIANGMMEPLVTFDCVMLHFGFCLLRTTTVKSLFLNNISGQRILIKYELKAKKHDKSKDNYGNDVFRVSS